MRTACLISLASFFGTLAPARSATAQEAEQLQNAALSYWQAFAVLPELDDEQDKIVSQWDTVDLNEAAVTLVQQSFKAMSLLHRGASIERCYWGSALEEGPGTLLPHLSKARLLARFACLRARYRFQHGQRTEAWQDVQDVLTLSHHISSEPLLISYLVGIAVERMAMTALTPHLQDFSEAELAGMLTDLNSLLPQVTLALGIEGERRWMLGWLRQKVADAEKKDLEDLVRGLIGSEPESKQAVEAVLREPVAVGRMFDDVDRYYDEMIGLLSLPATQQQAEWEKLEQRMNEGNNPWARLLLPAIGSLFAVEQEAKVRWAMLLAAVDIARGGPEQLQRHQDPGGDGLFQFRPRSKGFELKSKLICKDKPVVLVVGPTE